MENYIKLTQKCIDDVLTINKNINMCDIKSIYINNIKMKQKNRNYKIYTSFYKDLIYDIVIELNKPIDCYRLFMNCNDIISIDLSNFDTSNTTTMQSMFNYCNALSSINFGNKFNTSKVTNMYAMFYNCKHLTSLDLTHFNTSKVIYMFDMFYNCNELNSLDLSSFDISKVTDMRGMFKYCDNLKTLNIKNIKTNENNEQLLNFLQEIKNIQNIIINPKNNLLLYRKLKEVRYK